MGAGSFWNLSVWQMIVLGGPLMWPIIFCSLFAMAIIIERLMFFSTIETNVSGLKRRVLEHVRQNRIKEAVQVCDAHASPVAKMMKAGLVKFGSSRNEMRESLEDMSSFEIPKLESRLQALSTLACVSLMLGLLGTVSGMMACFNSIHMRAVALNPVTPGDLAGGISEAMLTTIAGLMVAIPAFIAYNYLVSRVKDVVHEMARAATELLNLIEQMSENPNINS